MIFNTPRACGGVFASFLSLGEGKEVGKSSIMPLHNPITCVGVIDWSGRFFKAVKR